MECCECGEEINHVLVNHFDHDGTDRLHVMELEDLGDGCYSILTDASWTGYGLETEDVLADFLNELNNLASDYGLVVGGYQQEEGMLQLLMVKAIGEDGKNDKGRSDKSIRNQ